MTYAPDGLKWLSAQLDQIAGSTPSGIVGDSAHGNWGYHTSRNNVIRYHGGDYSTQLPLDKQGPADAASAVDMSFTASQMKVVTQRLIAAAEHPDDNRLDALREFYGTTDGRNVTGRSHDAPGQYWVKVSSDSSHLWHIHLSIFRAFCDDKTKLAPIVDVMSGVPWGGSTPTVPETGEDTMTPEDLMKADVVPNRDWRTDAKTNPNVRYEFAMTAMWDGIHNLEVEAAAQRVRDEALLSAVKGVDTASILAKIDQVAAADAARVEAVRTLIAQVQAGGATADEIVAKIAEKLAD